MHSLSCKAFIYCTWNGFKSWFKFHSVGNFVLFDLIPKTQFDYSVMTDHYPRILSELFTGIHTHTTMMINTSSGVWTCRRVLEA